MCGISGFYCLDKVFSKEDLVKMTDAMAHRGPDASGYFYEGFIGLGHRRLSIIDISSNANQPMHSHSGRYVIVFNGEIYNFQELRRQLSDYDYKSKGDTEVMLAAYERWGTDAFVRFNGIFAFALQDIAKQELMLVRDRAGIKPLYYHWDGKRLIFSSEIKALLEYDIPRELDHEAFAHYMHVLYVPAPLTMFKHIKKLEPGHMLRLKDGRISITPFVTKDTDRYDGPVTDEALRATIDAAVERQLVQHLQPDVRNRGKPQPDPAAVARAAFRRKPAPPAGGPQEPAAQRAAAPPADHSDCHSGGASLLGAQLRLAQP